MVRRRAVFYILFALMITTPTLSWAWSGEVVRITDGDTITVLNRKTLKDVKIRLYGIDTPEKGQAFGKRASNSLPRQCTGRWSRFTAWIPIDMGELWPW